MLLFPFFTCSRATVPRAAARAPGTPGAARAADAPPVGGARRAQAQAQAQGGRLPAEGAGRSRLPTRASWSAAAAAFRSRPASGALRFLALRKTEGRACKRGLRREEDTTTRRPDRTGSALLSSPLPIPPSVGLFFVLFFGDRPLLAFFSVPFLFCPVFSLPLFLSLSLGLTSCPFGWPRPRSLPRRTWPRCAATSGGC